MAAPVGSLPYEITWEHLLLQGAGACFARPDLPLEVEIGPGDDDFLLQSAVDGPDRNWLGIEYSHKRVARYGRKVERRAPGLGNLRLIWRPAFDVVEPFLSPAKVRAYHVHFPDPWPKKHHGRYRLLGPTFLAALAESLVDGGLITVVTDEVAYRDEIVEAIAHVPALERVVPSSAGDASRPDVRATRFEERWRTMGRTIHRMRLRRRVREPAPGQRHAERYPPARRRSARPAVRRPERNPWRAPGLSAGSSSSSPGA